MGFANRKKCTFPAIVMIVMLVIELPEKRKYVRKHATWS